jgi:hypothetical protein
VDAPERRSFLDRFVARYDELRGDQAAWAEVAAERAVESGALVDKSRRDM